MVAKYPRRDDEEIIYETTACELKERVNQLIVNSVSNKGSGLVDTG